MVKMQRSWRVHPRDHQTIDRDLLHVVPILPVRKEFALFAVILAFGLSVSIS